MSTQEKVSEIDLKIKILQEKKKKLEEKQLLQLSHLVKNTEAQTLPSYVLIGVLLDAVKAFKEKQDIIQKWQKTGSEFLELRKKKNDKINENEEEEIGKNKKVKESSQK